MTVADLISELEYYDKDAEVLIKVSNSMYAESIGVTTEKKIRAFWGDDWSAVVICGDEQVGAV